MENFADIKNLSEQQIEILASLESEYREQFGDKFISLYIYGSSARGEAQNGSDLDNVAIVDFPSDYFKTDDYKIWVKETEAKLKTKFPEGNPIDVAAISTQTAKQADWVIILKLDGFLVSGDDILQNFDIPEDPKIFVKALNERYFNIIPEMWNTFQNDPNPQEKHIASLSRYFSKVALRLGLALVILKQNDTSIFTNNVTNQHKIVSEKLLDYKDLNDLAFLYRYSPNINAETLKRIGNQLMNLITELKNYL